MHKIMKHFANTAARHGWWGEQFALLALLFKGYRPLARNWRGSSAEVDILVWKKNTLVLVEVKFRREQLLAHNALRPDQAQRLKHQAQRLRSRYPELTIRGDLLLVYPHFPFIEHHQNALALDEG